MDLADTEEMDAFFAQLARLNQAQLMSLRAAWRSTSHETHEDAWTTVRAIGARDGLAKEIDRVRDRALAWATRGSNAVPYYQVNDDSTWQQVKMEAGEAIVDAALAVALGGRLDAATRNVLIGPWLQATEAAE
jgi:hypothetical protein